jgi:hypothetical protein
MFSILIGSWVVGNLQYRDRSRRKVILSDLCNAIKKGLAEISCHGHFNAKMTKINYIEREDQTVGHQIQIIRQMIMWI